MAQVPSGIRKGLTPAKILKTSFDLVEAEGESGLTMRALARRLDVAAMAIYNHFRDRDAILDALAEQVFASLASPSAAGTAAPYRQWKQRLRAIVLNASNIASRSPHIYRLALTRPRKPASAFQLTSEALDLLRHAGLTRLQSETVYSALVMILQGLPFWKESMELHAKTCGTSFDADRHFSAVVDWLLESVSLSAGVRRRRSPRP